MKILKEENGEVFFLNTTQINLKNISSLKNEVALKILKLISKNSMYPKQIAKTLKLHEQNIYYYIKKLEEAKLIKISKKEKINGILANYYVLESKSFFIKFSEFEKATTFLEKKSSFLEPFISDGKLDALIVVGSPDPHGPQKARSKDGYFGMDLALFLGSFLNFVPESRVKLDTEISNYELENNNLIVIGGPIVNKVTSFVNKKMTIYYDEEKKGIFSKITKKTYFNDEIGFINKFISPYNSKKKILLVAGLRNSGTKASITAFLKHFDDVKKGNLYDNKIMSKVVEGLDLDSDGIVDDVEFLE